MDYVATWLFAFVWTLAFELPVYALVLRRCRIDWRSLLALGSLVNLVTHPALSGWVYATEPPRAEILVAEAVVALVESLLVFVLPGERRSLSRAIAAGLLANSASFGAGTLLFAH